jgi:hypothetical protein
MDTQRHWQNIYGKKAADAVSWCRPHLETSLELIECAAPENSASIIDIGRGESTFVDDLRVRHRDEGRMHGHDRDLRTIANDDLGVNDPAIVFSPPGLGIVVGGAIRFGFFVTIGDFFHPWGWVYCRFDWGSDVVIINNAPWRRTWINRREYVHPYEIRRYSVGERLPEQHALHERTERERAAARDGIRCMKMAVRRIYSWLARFHICPYALSTGSKCVPLRRTDKEPRIADRMSGNPASPGCGKLGAMVAG